MPVEIPPQRIEISQLDGGFVPDPPESLVPLNCATDMTNLLPDPYSHNPEVRKGFERLPNGVITSLGSRYYIKHVYYYEYISSGSRERLLMCIVTNGIDAQANNVQVWKYDLKESTFTRVDTVGTSWTKSDTPHWYAVVEGTYYGGTRGSKIYSYNGTTWNADPTTPDVKTWVDDTGDTVDLDNEWPRNYAFKSKTQVAKGTKFYTAARDMRFKTWETDEHYSKGEKVSRKVDHGTNVYWRSFQAIDSHASSADNKPGEGGSWQDYWKNIKLKDVEDEDDELTDDWNYNPLPGKTSVGTYHGFRMFVRHDDSDNWSRVQYSEPARPEKNEEIADLVWRAKRWAFVDDTEGDGGGYFNVPFKRGDAIRALTSYGNYLIISGRWETFVLSGTNENTWTLRSLSTESGTLGITSICEHEGLVYYITAGGMLYRTDGTSAEPAPNTEAVREYLKDLADQVLDEEDTNHNMPQLWSYGRKLWMCFPNTGVVLVYDATLESWWRQELPIQAVTVGAAQRASRMFASTYRPGEHPALFVYRDDPGDEIFTDDDWEGGSSIAHDAIPVRYRTAWFEYGQFRNERRVRRTWVVLSGQAALPVNVDTYKNFDPELTVEEADRVLLGTHRAEYVEGRVPDGTSYATQLEISANVTEDFSLTGIGIEAQEVRDRYGKGR